MVVVTMMLCEICRRLVFLFARADLRDIARWRCLGRQVRGRIVKILVKESPLTLARIVQKTGMDAERVKKNLIQLEEEGFVNKKGRAFCIR